MEEREEKFTPGPWFPHKQIVGDDIIVFISTARGLFGADPLATSTSVTEQVTCLCKGEKKQFPIEANAHLIAAAPELYEACQAFLKAWDTEEELETASKKARVALKKAVGQQ